MIRRFVIVVCELVSVDTRGRVLTDTMEVSLETSTFVAVVRCLLVNVFLSSVLRNWHGFFLAPSPLPVWPHATGENLLLSSSSLSLSFALVQAPLRLNPPPDPDPPHPDPPPDPPDPPDLASFNSAVLGPPATPSRRILSSVNLRVLFAMTVAVAGDPLSKSPELFLDVPPPPVLQLLAQSLGRRVVCLKLNSFPLLRL
ncbi:unnamed protein product [Microthlaspi erraticum]|uniref:Uncharacterized protein n=1 Tax=Microthlaspi erraticum TaxID=1685480 RepID=A0A6D2KTP7_9BRAS|nr:unnamed protein product [Microthlaspi erraticum]